MKLLPFLVLLTLVSSVMGTKWDLTKIVNYLSVWFTSLWKSSGNPRRGDEEPLREQNRFLKKWFGWFPFGWGRSRNPQRVNERTNQQQTHFGERPEEDTVEEPTNLQKAPEAAETVAEPTTIQPSMIVEKQKTDVVPGSLKEHPSTKESIHEEPQINYEDVVPLRYAKLQVKMQGIWIFYAYAIFVGSQKDNRFLMSIHLTQYEGVSKRLYFEEKNVVIELATDGIKMEDRYGLLLITLPLSMTVHPRYHISPYNVVHVGKGFPTEGKVLINGELYSCIITKIEGSAREVTVTYNGETDALLPPRRWRKKRMYGTPLIATVEKVDDTLVGLYYDTQYDVDMFILTTVFPVRTVGFVGDELNN